MKKIFIITLLLILVLNANAQDVYSVGYYNVSGGTIAALYKNGDRIYTAHYTNQTSKATSVTSDLQGNVYWLVDFYDYPSNTYSYSEIRKNGQVYTTNENHQEVHISDMYCLNDTLYCIGYQYNEDSIMVATVWKGENFAIHWILGDGIHHSTIAYSDIDKQTNIPYFCGYVIDGKKRAAVWEAQELLNTFDQDSLNMYEEITQSNAIRMTVANGHVYTIGSFDTDWPVNLSAIWEDNALMHHYGPYEPTIHDVCTFEDFYYCAIADRWGDGILENGQDQVLWIGYAYKLFSTNTDIYVIGEDFDYNFYIWKNFEKQCQIENCEYIFDMTVVETSGIPDNSEWYYEIQNDDGCITYQHLQCAGDTVVSSQRPKIIVRSNTQYDKDIPTEVTHEYVYEKNGIVYWWNKDLEEFTTLYDLNAEAGDEWEIKVGTESITVYVDSVGVFEYEGEARRVLHISDAGNIFNGDIVVGYGHMTSFFPERLMNRNADFNVNGLRCYWVGDVLLYHNGDEDCDAVYQQYHDGIDENETIGFAVYPNPANGVLFVETQNFASLPDPTYHITNLVGQTLMSGQVETRRATSLQIDISSLPAGMYFISVGEQTVKFVKQ